MGSAAIVPEWGIVLSRGGSKKSRGWPVAPAIDEWYYARSTCGVSGSKIKRTQVTFRRGHLKKDDAKSDSGRGPAISLLNQR